MDTKEWSAAQSEDFALVDILTEYGAAPDPNTYQIPESAPSPKRSSLPTEEEVRAYLSAYARGEAEPSFEPRRESETEAIDERFLMAGEHRRTRYGAALDRSPEADYTPPQSETSISTHAPEPDETTAQPGKAGLFKRVKNKLEQSRIESDRKEAKRREAAQKLDIPQPAELILPGEEAAHKVEARESAPAEKPIFTPAWVKESCDRGAYASAFPDTSASPAVYAEKRAKDLDEEEEDARIPLKKSDYFPSSFKEYLSSLLTSVFYGLRRGAASIVTVEEDDEDLGAEVTPANASRYYGQTGRSMRLRLRLCGLIALFMLWISLGLPVTGQLNNIRVAAYFCLGAQLTVMLLSQDLVTNAVLNAFRRRFGADTLAVAACLMTSLDALLVGHGGLVSPHLPLCVISTLSLCGAMLSSFLSCRGLRKSLRVPAIAKRCYAVTGEMSLRERGTTILKSLRPTKGFVRRSEEAPPDESLFQKLGLPLLALVVLLSLITSLATKNLKDFIYIFSALLCASVPFGALLCFALPFFNGSFRMFSSGAAIAGWSGLCDVGLCKNLIVTDRDLFPDGTVEIEQIRIFADAKPERIISYAGSMLTACGSCVAKSFGELMEENHCAMRQIENFEYLSGGGMRGVIDSSVILCGSSDLMQLMNVRIPFRLVGRTSVLLAVDGVLYGIFNMKYTPDPQVKKALIELMRTARHPIFAIRDFNVTPAMLHDCFDLATDGYDFPPYVDRFAISSVAPGDDSKIAAVVCRDGLGPLGRMARIGRSMYVAVRTSLRITALGAFAGVFAVFFHMLRTGGVSASFLFLLMLLFALPVLLLGTFLELE